MAKFEIRDGEAIIPEGATEIGEETFYGCTSLKSITIPESVTEIGFGAFTSCSSLKSITIKGEATVFATDIFLWLHFACHNQYSSK